MGWRVWNRSLAIGGNRVNGGGAGFTSRLFFAIFYFFASTKEL